MARFFAAILGGLIGYNLPDWIGKFVNNSQPPVTVKEDRKCNLVDVARAYLNNLQRDQVDKVQRGFPPRIYDWSLPNGFGVRVIQGFGKDGLSFDVQLKGPGGSVKVIKAKAEVSQKGIKIPVMEVPFVVGGENFGKINFELRVDGGGVNELGVTFTSHSGKTFKLKLKPNDRCNLDLSAGQMLKVNQGSQADAQKWAELHLAESAKQHNGNLFPGLMDLLMFVQPATNGQYRNHGSQALDVLTNALNLLKQSGVDMKGLKDIQDAGKKSIFGSADYDSCRLKAQQWLQKQLSLATRDGRIDAQELSNPFHINFGVQSIETANRIRRSPASVSQEKNNTSATQININLRKVQEAAGNLFPVTQTRSGDLFVAMTEVQVNDTSAVEALLIRLARALGVERNQLQWAKSQLTLLGVHSPGIVVRAHRF